MNHIVASLKKSKTGWRIAMKSEADVNGYKQELLLACMENKINSMEKIKQGLEQARKDPSDFFPSVGKFISWCTDDSHWEHKAFELQAKKTDELLALEKPPVDKEAGLEWLQNLKSDIGI